MQEEIHFLRKKFIQAYVYNLIQNSYKPKQAENNDIQIPKYSGELLDEKPKIQSPFYQKEIEEFKLPITQQKKIQETNITQLRSKQLEEKKDIAPVKKEKKTIQAIKPEMVPKRIQQNSPVHPAPKPAQLPQLPPLMSVPQPKKGYEIYLNEKINRILRDPTVFSVECSGHDKPLIVNRGGQIQVSNVKLTEKEIEDVINSISEYTRIPLTPGLFKAAIHNLLITAVISNYAGIRFILQKRLPFQ